MVRPTFWASMRSASCKTLKCADIVGFETSKCSASSPAERGCSRSSCRTRRRVGSDSALKTRFTSRCLANHLNVVKRLRAVEPIEVHHLVPGADEVAHELLLRIVAGVGLGERAQLGVRAEDEVEPAAGPLGRAGGAAAAGEEVGRRRR